jgi:hypothetical protein
VPPRQMERQCGFRSRLAGNDASLFPYSSICFPSSLTPSEPSSTGYPSIEIHRALQVAALYCFFDGGVVFGPQFGLLGSDSGVDGSSFNLRALRVQRRRRCRLRSLQRLLPHQWLLLMLCNKAFFQSPKFSAMLLVDFIRSRKVGHCEIRSWPSPPRP